MLIAAAAIAVGLDSIVQEEMKSNRTPGVAIALVRGGSVTYARGFGVANIETGMPVTPDTAFEVASITKSFTAAALLSYAERKVIDIDAPVGRYVSLPGCLGSAPIRTLLSHTSGIRDEPDEFGPDGDAALAEFVKTWTPEDYCLFAPGTAFSYSNAGFTLAGMVLEKVAAMPFADAVAETVLKPLKMTHSAIRPAMVMMFPHAVGHKLTPNGIEVIRPIANDARQWPAGGLFASANDLARFAIALMNGGVVEGQQVLPPAVVRAMMTPRASMPGRQYGYGLFVLDDRGRVVEHGGVNPGFTALIRIRPEQHCDVVLLGNSDAYMRKTADEAMASCRPEGAPPAAPETTSIPTSEMAQYEGKYVQPRRWSIEIARRGDELLLRQFEKEFPLRRISADRLAFLPAPEARPKEIVFHRDSGGMIDLLQLDVWAFKKTSR